MSLLVEPEFWGCSACAYLLCHVRIAGQRTVWFGVLNLSALTFLLGWRSAAAVLGLALALWIVLGLATVWRRRGLRGLERGAVISVLAALVALFVAHKGLLEGWSLFDQREEDSQSVWSRMESIATVARGLGLSYVFLRALDLLRAVSTRHVLLDPISLAGYLAPFHMLLAGPVNGYDDHVAMNEQRPPRPTMSRLVRCANLITTGLFMKFVCAEGMRILYVGVDGQFEVRSLFDSAFIFVYVFFDFAGYSAVALGIGRLCYVPTPSNFRFPFAARNVTDFWTRWHISLGEFVKRNVFTPVQVYLVRRFGVRSAYKVNLVTMILAFTFVGLWHRFSWSFLLWGLGMGCFLALEKTARDRLLKVAAFRKAAAGIAPRLLGPCYVFAVIVGSLHWVMKELLGQ